jgi:cytochrome P450
MLDAPELPARDKTEFRLALEVRTFVGAGTETTGNTLSVTTFHLLANPDKARRLKEEVQAAQNKSSTPLKYQELLQLPYLVSSPPFFHVLALFLTNLKVLSHPRRPAVRQVRKSTSLCSRD